MMNKREYVERKKSRHITQANNQENASIERTSFLVAVFMFVLFCLCVTTIWLIVCMVNMHSSLSITRKWQTEINRLSPEIHVPQSIFNSCVFRCAIAKPIQITTPDNYFSKTNPNRIFVFIPFPLANLFVLYSFLVSILFIYLFSFSLISLFYK